MAVITPVWRRTPLDCSRFVLLEWAGLGTGDTAEPVVIGGVSDKSVQVTGTITALDIVGSIDPDPATAVFHVLNDSRGEGNPLSFTAADLRTILEHTYLLKPSGITGSGITVRVLGVMP